MNPQTEGKIYHAPWLDPEFIRRAANRVAQQIEYQLLLGEQYKQNAHLPYPMDVQWERLGDTSPTKEQLDEQHFFFLKPDYLERNYRPCFIAGVLA